MEKCLILFKFKSVVMVLPCSMKCPCLAVKVWDYCLH